jgi:hypothetical protein
MQLIYPVCNGFDLSEELGLVLLVQHNPVLNIRDELETVQAVDGLIEVGADRVEFLPERDHIGQKIIDALIPVPDADRLVERDAADIVAEVAAGCLLEKGLEGFVFGFVEAGVDLFVAEFFLLLHGWFVYRVLWFIPLLTLEAADGPDYGGSGSGKWDTACHISTSCRCRVKQGN